MQEIKERELRAIIYFIIASLCVLFDQDFTGYLLLPLLFFDYILSTIAEEQSHEDREYAERVAREKEDDQVI